MKRLAATIGITGLAVGALFIPKSKTPEQPQAKSFAPAVALPPPVQFTVETSNTVAIITIQRQDTVAEYACEWTPMDGWGFHPVPMDWMQMGAATIVFRHDLRMEPFGTWRVRRTN